MCALRNLRRNLPLFLNNIKLRIEKKLFKFRKNWFAIKVSDGQKMAKLDHKMTLKKHIKSHFV